MRHEDTTRLTPARGSVRTLRQQEELPLLRDHLLRLDPESRHDRFHGFMDDSFIERYAAKCADDGTVIIAYIEDGVVRGAAELHPPDQSPDSLPEIAFSVEARVRRQGVGSILFRKLIAEARSKGYRSLRITTGAQNRGDAGARAQIRRESDVPAWRSPPGPSIWRRSRSPQPATARDRDAGRCRARDGQRQPRLLEDAAANVWLGPDRLTGNRQQKNPSPIGDLRRVYMVFGRKGQVPVRLSLPNFRTTRRSTTIERCAPCSPAMTRVTERPKTGRAAFFTSA